MPKTIHCNLMHDVIYFNHMLLTYLTFEISKLGLHHTKIQTSIKTMYQFLIFRFGQFALKYFKSYYDVQKVLEKI